MKDNRIGNKFAKKDEAALSVITIRCTQAEKNLLVVSASRQGKSLTSFILPPAIAAAKEYVKLEPKVYKNKNFKKRDHYCTTIVCCVSVNPPDKDTCRFTIEWEECDNSELQGLCQLETINGITYYGYL